MCDVTHNNYFGPVLTAINEVHSRKDYIIDNIFACFYQSETYNEAFTEYKNMTR